MLLFYHFDDIKIKNDSSFLEVQVILLEVFIMFFLLILGLSLSLTHVWATKLEQGIIVIKKSERIVTEVVKMVQGVEMVARLVARLRSQVYVALHTIQVER